MELRINLHVIYELYTDNVKLIFQISLLAYKSLPF